MRTRKHGHACSRRPGRARARPCHPSKNMPPTAHRRPVSPTAPLSESRAHSCTATLPAGSQSHTPSDEAKSAGREALHARSKSTCGMIFRQQLQDLAQTCGLDKASENRSPSQIGILALRRLMKKKSPAGREALPARPVAKWFSLNKTPLQCGQTIHEYRPFLWPQWLRVRRIHFDGFLLVLSKTFTTLDVPPQTEPSKDRQGAEPSLWSWSHENTRAPRSGKPEGEGQATRISPAKTASSTPPDKQRKHKHLARFWRQPVRWRGF
jgi:hypothetical protein